MHWCRIELVQPPKKRHSPANIQDSGALKYLHEPTILLTTISHSLLPLTFPLPFVYLDKQGENDNSIAYGIRIKDSIREG